MAEAMARKYGSDVLSAASAGTAPAPNSYHLTRSLLSEVNVDLGEQIPKALRDVDLSRYDLIINMSGSPLLLNAEVPVETWEVEDPYGRSEELFRRTRGDIEMRVIDLILRARLGKVRPLKKTAHMIDSGRSSSRQ